MEMILYLIYYAAHMTAGLLGIFLMAFVYAARDLELAAWGLTALCLALLDLDRSGRVSLRGSVGKILAALAVPALCGCVDVLFRQGSPQSPAAWSVFAALFLLAGYILLREEPAVEEAAPLVKAEALLVRGSILGTAEAFWLVLLGCGVVFMATFGLLFTILLGALIASRNGLLDYDGLVGVLAGLLVLHLIQALWYWKGERLVKAEDPWLDVGGLHFALLIPIWNSIQARRLAKELWTRRMREGGEL